MIPDDYNTGGEDPDCVHGHSSTASNLALVDNCGTTTPKYCGSVKDNLEELLPHQEVGNERWLDAEMLKSKIGRQWSRSDIAFDSDEAQKITELLGRIPLPGEWVDSVKLDATNLATALEDTAGFVIRIDSEMLYIDSRHLMQAFRQAVNFYPDIDLLSNPLTIHEPCRVLYQYLPKVKSHIQQDDQEAQSHLRVLAYYFEKEFAEKISIIKQSLDYAEIAYEHLWILFPNGETLVAKDELGEWRVFTCLCIKEVKRDSHAERAEDPFGGPMVYITGSHLELSWLLKAWCTIWDPSRRMFIRQMKSFNFIPFSGTWKIKTLPVYPLKHFGDDAAQVELLRRIKERGHRWSKLVSAKPPLCRMHKGPALTYKDSSLESGFGGRDYGHDEAGVLGTQPITREGRVIPDERLRFDPTFAPQNFRSGANDPWNKWLQFEHEAVPPSDQLPDDLALHAPACITAFDIPSQTWCIVSVDHLTDVKWETKALDHLVLDEDKKLLLRCLVDDRNVKMSNRIGDVISGKGRGLTIVLHGPPGVGKTLTAESIAEYLERPLLPMALTTLVGNYHTGDGLKAIFQAAVEWNAILLLDEADVVLEARSFEDVHRNASVSRFLKDLEYFNGILFLTTNRLETIDVAFQSRIQIALQFDEMNVRTRRKIWERFIKLIKDREAQDELEEKMDYLKKLPLNGRQIRNIVNIAQTLAAGSPEGASALRFKHIQQAVDETLAFNNFFSKNSKPNVRKSRVRTNFVNDSGAISSKVNDEDSEAD